MSVKTAAAPEPPSPPSPLSPARLQRRSHLALRRRLMLALNAASWLLALVWLVSALGADGFGALDALALLLAALALAWPIFAFWNAMIALALLLLGLDRTAVSPYARALEQPLRRAGPRPRVAVAMCVRNEDPARAIARLIALRESLEAADPAASARTELHLLSDSDDPDIAAAERALFARRRGALAGEGRTFYRRREANDGFKAGNLYEMVERADPALAYLLVLDADGVMDGETLLDLVRIMEAHPRIGLLQSLIDPAPGRSGFTRLLRFSARVSVRSHYLGQAWWQADRGPYGGHGALIRMAPFRALGPLAPTPGPPPFGGAVLGHDHVEAALLRDAGWEVRLWPERCGSYEDHPVSLGGFLGRERRWARGTLQYLGLLRARPDLSAMARFHLGHWSALHLSQGAALPATALLVAALGAGAWPALAALAATLAAPKLVAYAESAASDGAAAYGGAGRYLASCALDLGFCAVLAPIASGAVLGAQIEALAARFGREVALWPAQRRESAVAALGDALAARGLSRLPEERAPPPILRRVAELDAEGRALPAPTPVA